MALQILNGVKENEKREKVEAQRFLSFFRILRFAPEEERQKISFFLKKFLGPVRKVKSLKT